MSEIIDEDHHIWPYLSLNLQMEQQLLDSKPQTVDIYNKTMLIRCVLNFQLWPHKQKHQQAQDVHSAEDG